MKLSIQTPNGSALAGLQPRFQRHLFNLGREAEQWEAALIQPGERLPILRVTKGRAAVEIVAWDAIEPTRFTTVSTSFADRCLVPVSGLSVGFGEGRCDLGPAQDELVMVAGWWQRLNATEPASVRLLFPAGFASENGPIVVPERSWEDWLDPNKDVRNLQRGDSGSWRRIEFA